MYNPEARRIMLENIDAAFTAFKKTPYYSDPRYYTPDHRTVFEQRVEDVYEAAMGFNWVPEQFSDEDVDEATYEVDPHWVRTIIREKFEFDILFNQ